MIPRPFAGHGNGLPGDPARQTGEVLQSRSATSAGMTAPHPHGASLGGRYAEPMLTSEPHTEN